MKTSTRLLLAALALLGLPQLIRRLRRSLRPHVEIGGSMVVGEVDEVELSAGIARNGTSGPEGYDPDRIPSANPEVNDLRSNMP